MNKLVFVAAALAAGAWSVAPSAASSDKGTSYLDALRVNKSAVTTAKSPQPGTQTDRGRSAAQKRSSAEAGKAAKRGSATKTNKSAKATKTAKTLKIATASGTARIRKGDAKKFSTRSRTVAAGNSVNRVPAGVDPMTTASIATLSRNEMRAEIMANAVRPATPAARYSEIVSHYASTFGVPASLAHAVITVESNYRVDALGSAGEIGLMQIKPATARMMGYSGPAKGLYDPDTNIKYGMMYLGKAHRLGGGQTCGTILRYNAGHAARRMNPVSSAYCSKVMRQMAGV